MNQKTTKQKKSKIELIKTLVVMVLFLLMSNFVIGILERTPFIQEPYDKWGSRIDIPVKINLCGELFSNNNEKTKIVMIGDSRPNFAFDPRILDNYFNNSTISFNLAIGATAIRFQSFFIKNIVIPKIKPNFILWEINYLDFSHNDNIQGNYIRTMGNPMARYYSNNKNGLNSEQLIDYYITKYLAFYRYSYFLTPKFLNLYPPKMDEEISNFQTRYSTTNGYYETLRQTVWWDKTWMIKTTLELEFLEGVEELFFDTISFIEAHNIPYLIISGSRGFRQIKNEKVDSIYQSLQKENFLKLNGNASLIEHELYYDYYHLNKLGAELYTNFVAQKIKRNIN